jgi:hypothetical protein
MYRYSSKIAWQSLDDEVVVIDLENRRVLGLNSSGAFVWTLAETHTVSQIADALSDGYDVEPSIARSEVQSFFDDMCGRGLLEKIA